ncbi:MAG: ferritin-like domain-containing protein [Aureispira sp.]|nr:ferritin-like domain-containing protein [Aureispira sp.]
MNNSQDWVRHFESNLKEQRIDWTQATQITNEEKKQIIRSLQAWQLGETSEGKNLRRAAEKYAKQQDDWAYLDAIDLFIKEEQKHGENLGLYLDRIGAKRLKKDLGDTLFRKVRYFATNIEIWTATVIIVESFAQIYYKAIADATNCPLLQEICVDILKDEAHHIRFQYERLHQITKPRTMLWKRITFAAYHLMFYIIMIAIWFGHRKALKAGGLDFKKYSSKARRKFRFVRHKIENVNTQKRELDCLEIEQSH